jgi:ABC-type Fe3+-hydroxamate transport system substrate-binding protein
MISLRDDLGRVITLPAPAKRIISLSPAIGENLFAIGAGGLLVGVTTADDYPPPVSRVTRIGDFGKPAYERIRALKPDLAIVEIASVDRATVENASARLKVPIFVQMSRRYADVPRHLEQLGKLTGHDAAAGKASRSMTARATQVQKRVAGQKPVTVFVEVSADPLYAAGPGSFVDDLIRRAGGVNIVKGTNPFPIFSKESLLVADPAHYIVATVGGQSGASTFKPPLDRLSAVKNGRIHHIPADYLFRPTPRLAQGLELLANALHGQGK